LTWRQLSNSARPQRSPPSVPRGVNDQDPLPLSALQHWAQCPRQCGLIHLEHVFDDNLHTLRGNAVHARVDRPGFECQIDLAGLELLEQRLLSIVDEVSAGPDHT
jgi:hypothetical protein